MFNYNYFFHISLIVIEFTSTSAGQCRYSNFMENYGGFCCKINNSGTPTPTHLELYLLNIQVWSVLLEAEGGAISQLMIDYTCYDRLLLSCCWMWNHLLSSVNSCRLTLGFKWPWTSLQTSFSFLTQSKYSLHQWRQ